MNIISKLTGKAIFESEHKTIDATVCAAVKAGTNLRGANLHGADLHGANLRRADLYEADLYGANLYEADLYEANLYGANLRRANFRGADLCEADLYEANLYGANLRRADLRGANLYGVNLYGADLRGANLYGADLHGANLRRTDLYEANLYEADLYGADLYGAVGLTVRLCAQFRSCPPSGDFTGWKKGGDGELIKLKIPWFSRRVNAIESRKCRCEMAIVMSIEKNGKKIVECVSGYDPNTVYRVGEHVCCDKYDASWLVECSGGIHFFMTQQEALDY
jgi:hypothetical protein